MTGRIAGLAVLWATVALPAQGATPLRAFLDRVDTLTAGFRQVQRDEDGRELHVTEGEVWLARPATAATGTGRFRWEYRRPYRQTLVCDGERIWLHDPDLSQVTVRDAVASLAGTPAELLAQRGTLERQFEVADVDGSGGRNVRLTPRVSSGDFRLIELGLRDDGTPERMSFHDLLGGSTTIEFRDVRVNARIDAARFTFTAPEGTDVIAEPVATPP